jgi:hypothetical protein
MTMPLTWVHCASSPIGVLVQDQSPVPIRTRASDQSFEHKGVVREGPPALCADDYECRANSRIGKLTRGLSHRVEDVRIDDIVVKPERARSFELHIDRWMRLRSAAVAAADAAAVAVATAVAAAVVTAVAAAVVTAVAVEIERGPYREFTSRASALESVPGI